MVKRRILTTVMSCLLAMGTMSSSYAAATTPEKTNNMYSTTIMLNGKKLPSPKAFTYNNTTYMPIFYVHNVLQSLGIKDSWNGSGKLQFWSLSTPDGTKPVLNLNAKSGTVNVIVNGATVEKNVVRVIRKDPFSGVPTTYIPIWYIQQILSAIGIQNTWNGTVGVKTWTLNTHKSSTGTDSTTGTTPSNPPVVNYQPGVMTLNPNTVSEIATVSSDNTRITFAGSPSQIKSLKPNDIFIVPPSKNYPDGAALKVVSVDNYNGQTIVQTTVPSFSEVVKTLHVDTSIPVSASEFIPDSGNTGGAATPIMFPKRKINALRASNSGPSTETNAIEIPFNLSVKTDILKGELGEDPNAPEYEKAVNGELEISGHLQLYSPSVSANLNYNYYGAPDGVSVNFHAKQVVQAEIAGGVSADASFTKQLKLGKFKIPLGETGLFLDIPVYLQFEVGGKAVVAFDFDSAATEDIGFTWDANGFRKTGNGIQPDGNAKPIHFNGSIEESVALGVDLDLAWLWYDVAGLSNTGGLKLEEAGTWSTSKSNESFLEANASLYYDLSAWIDFGHKTTFDLLTLSHQIWEWNSVPKEIRDDFSSNTGMWELKGNAKYDDTRHGVALTANDYDQSGQMWLKVPIKGPFSVDFKFLSGQPGGADGYVFMFYKQRVDDDNPPGGGSLGFEGKGYGIEFDTWQNGEFNDPTIPYVGLIQDDVSNHIATSDPIDKLDDGQMHDAHIDVADDSVNVYIDGQKVLSWHGTFDTTYENIGFSSATGSSKDDHFVTDITIDLGTDHFINQP